jgi:peptide/nickel transport system substrate-binding protein
MKRPWLSTLAGAAVLALSVAGFAGSAQAKTLRWAFTGDVATLDPYAHTESFTANFLHHIYEPLVRRDKELAIEPALAVSWEILEPTVWRFKLREGVKFHNGNPFTADDVVASVTRLLDPDARARGNLRAVVEAKKVDDYTVDFVLEGPYPLLLNDLSGVFIMDEEWMKENDALKPGNISTGTTTYASTHTNGTGPFILESYQADAKTVLVVNPDWWDKPEHNLTRIEFTPITSDATRVAALLSGEIDLMFPAPLQDVNRINSAGGFSVIEDPALRLIMLGMEQQAEHLHAYPEGNPLKDLRVRKALYQAIDMDLIRDRIMRGKSRNTALLVAPPVPGYSEELDVRLSYDPEAAKQLLSEAGFPDGFKTGLDCPNDRYVNDEEICVAIASMWAKIGVQTDLVTQTKSNHFPKVDNGETDIYMIGWATLPPMDAYSVLSSLLTAKAEGYGGNNPGGYTNARIEELTRAAAVELDVTKRRAMMSEALKIARDEVAYIPLHQQPLSWGVRDGVHVIQHPDEYIRLWFATVD